MEIKKKPNNRGFGTFTFFDLYGAECSIQESSLATDEAIWVGIDEVHPKVMASSIGKVNPETGEMSGWMKIPLPEGALICGRMHLNRQQVIALLPALTHFAATGRLPEELKEYEPLCTNNADEN